MPQLDTDWFERQVWCDAGFEPGVSGVMGVGGICTSGDGLLSTTMSWLSWLLVLTTDAALTIHSMPLPERRDAACLDVSTGSLLMQSCLSWFSSSSLESSVA